MDFNQLLTTFLEATNEVLTAATVVIALSLLLYNLTRNLRNRIARSSAVVLGCVVFTYVCEAFISLDPTLSVEAMALRLQWVGIAYIPAALFHLSDALLATTGLPSRGRRRRIVRILYGISTAFLFAALTSDILTYPVLSANVATLQDGPLFWVFLAYFIVLNMATFINVNRARQRALTSSTQRRLFYMQAAILTPAIGIFPYSVLLTPGGDSTIWISLLVNVANVIVILMLIFLSYPLSFFGSDKPDRVVKVELLRFLLRGPGTGLLALGIIIFTTQATRILGLSGDQFMPFAVVAIVLFWQWSIHLSLPWLERTLVYSDEDDEQFSRLQDLSDRMLSRSDLQQLIEATLETMCDYLRLDTAFIISTTGNTPNIIQTIGEVNFDDLALINYAPELNQIARRLTADDSDNTPQMDSGVQIGQQQFVDWQDYLIAPLYSTRQQDENRLIIGFLGFAKRADMNGALHHDDQETLAAFILRIEQTLDDLLLQSEIFAALEGLLPQISMTRSRAGAMEFRSGYGNLIPGNLPPREEIYEQVRAALKQYWGGPGISRSRLYELAIVKKRLSESDTPIHALRSVLQEAVELQRPEGERSMLGVEWIIYNILDLRFIEGKKVREVTKRLSMSDADFYRKQRLAIEAVVDTLIELETAEQTTET